MVFSMTGYGRGKAVQNGRDITVEIKSVNSRYFEYSSRVPRSFQFMDDKLKKLLGASISRGKAEFALTVQNVGVADAKVSVNLPLAQGYHAALSAIAATLGVRDDNSASAIARFPDVLTLGENAQDEDQLWLDVQVVASEAVKNFLAMRAAEGEKLVEDVRARLTFIEAAVAEIETTSEERVQKYQDKLYTRLTALLENTEIDEARVLTEAAIFADKTAVDEETVRLRSHIGQYKDILAQGGAIGRKLDFLTQELNREVNTIGSKCSEISITRLVVDIKSEIEKIREQIQNIE